MTEWAYAYDGLDRLKTATRNGTEDEVFTYDLAGNRVSKTLGGASTTSYVYNALDRLETETTGGVNTVYDYDGNGNLTAKTSVGQTESYVYDSRNRLRQVSSGPTGQGVLQYEFAYDYSGARFAKADLTGGPEPQQTDFLIDNNNLTGYSQTFLELNHDTGDVDKCYEYGDDLYAQVCWGDAINPPPIVGEGQGGGETLFFLYDGLGSTRSLTNSTGAIVQSYNYRPFGEGIDQPGELATNHLFTGEYFDSNLDYYYLRARYYSPGLGRFTGYDPVEDANNKLHRYAYCGGDAINTVDLSGMFGGDYTYIGELAALIIVSIVCIADMYNYDMFRVAYSNRDRHLKPATMIGFDFDLFAGTQIWSFGISGSLEAVYIPNEGRWFEYFSIGGALSLGTGIGFAITPKFGRVYNLAFGDDYNGAVLTSTGRVGINSVGRSSFGVTGFLYNAIFRLDKAYHHEEIGGYNLFGKRVCGWALPCAPDWNYSTAISPIGGSISATTYMYSYTGLADYLNHNMDEPSQDDDEFMDELVKKGKELYGEAEWRIRQYHQFHP